MNGYYFFEGGVVAVRAGPEALAAMKTYADDIATKLNNINGIGDQGELLQNEFRSILDSYAGSDYSLRSITTTGAIAFGIGLGLAIGGTTVATIGAGIAIGLAGEYLYKKAIEAAIGIGQRAGEAAYDVWGPNKVDPTVNRDFNNARTWLPRSDPLTLDLDGDGLETVGIDPNNPILFDQDGDGVSNATGWIKPDDGFLVFDRNGDGLINNGTELFGDSTPLAAGGKAADGFAALAQEDTNHDGVVNSGDANWANLRVWKDANSDGVSDEGELHTLESQGIAGMFVAKTENTTPLANGNQIADLGLFIRTDGTGGSLAQVTGTLADIDLADNPFYRSFSDTIPSTAQTATLPTMQGSGALRDLREAATLSPALAAIVADYAAADTKAGQMAQVDGVISQWAGSTPFQTGIEKAFAQGLRLTYLIPGLTPADLSGMGLSLGGGGQGIDTVISPFDYTLAANVDNLTLTGVALNGTGNVLDNVIVGTDADNTLIGLDGKDTLDGGAGAISSERGMCSVGNLDRLCATSNQGISMFKKTNMRKTAVCRRSYSLVRCEYSSKMTPHRRRPLRVRVDRWSSVPMQDLTP